MRSLEDNVLLLLVAAVSVAFAQLLAPFYGTLLWGTVFAIMFTPLYRWLARALGGKCALASLLTILIIVVMLILPLVFLTALLTNEVVGLYQGLRSGELNLGGHLRNILAVLPPWVFGALNYLGLGSVTDIQTRAAATVTRVSQFLAAGALSLGQNTLSFLVRLLLMLYLLFFFLRDGTDLTRHIANAIPMRPELLRALATRFAAVVRATIKSNLVIAVLQGALGALIFLILGIRSPLLWGALMAVLSLLPLVGPGLVWIPAALILLTTGSVWQGVVLTVYGVLVLGLVDNIVRPLMVGKDTSMPDYLVLISTLGGLVVFGVNGFIVGPLIAAMFVAAWDIFTLERNHPPFQPLAAPRRGPGRG